VLGQRGQLLRVALGFAGSRAHPPTSEAPGVAEALLEFSLRERVGAAFTRGSKEPIDLRASR